MCQREVGVGRNHSRPHCQAAACIFCKVEETPILTQPRWRQQGTTPPPCLHLVPGARALFDAPNCGHAFAYGSHLKIVYVVKTEAVRDTGKN